MNNSGCMERLPYCAEGVCHMPYPRAWRVGLIRHQEAVNLEKLKTLEAHTEKNVDEMRRSINQEGLMIKVMVFI